MIFSRLLAD